MHPERIFPFRVRWFLLVTACLLAAAHPGVIAGTQSFFHRDFGVLGYPFLHFHREAFWSGEVPLWNPLSNCGAPLLAQWGTMVLYPGSLWYLLLPMPWSVGSFSMLHMLLGGAGMWFLARRWMGAGAGPALAGVAFVFGGVSQSSLMWPNYTVALGWMPWVVLAVQRLAAGGGREMVVCAAVGSMQMLSGVPEISLITWLLAGGCLVAPVALGDNSRHADILPRLKRLGVVVLIVTGLSAAQLLPFFELLAHSQRQSAASSMKWAMPAWGWGNLLVPAFHYFETYQGTLVQSGQNFFTTYYCGLPVLMLAMLGVWSTRRRMTTALAVVAVAGMLLAMGDAFLPNKWLRALIPSGSLARYPVKFVVMTAFALPMLAGFGIQWLIGAGTPARGRVRKLAVTTLLGFAGAGVVLWLARAQPLPLDSWARTWQSAAGRGVFLAACFGVGVGAVRAANRRQASLCALGLTGLVWFDLQTHLPLINPTLARDHLTVGLGAQQASFDPAPAPGRGRVFITPEAETLLLRSTIPDLGQDFLAKRLALWSNLNVLDGIPKVNGSSTLRMAHEDQVQERIYDDKTMVSGSLLSFLGVTHRSADHSPLEWVVNPAPMPWVTAGQHPVWKENGDALEFLFSDGFKPLEEVILPAELKNSVTAERSEDAVVNMLQFHSGRVSIECQSSHAMFIVIAQSWHPRWKAEVDGFPARVMRANHAFQAVEVPEGRHRVDLEFRDGLFEWGAGLSALTLCGCGGAVLCGRRRGR